MPARRGGMWLSRAVRSTTRFYAAAGDQPGASRAGIREITFVFTWIRNLPEGKAGFRGPSPAGPGLRSDCRRVGE